MLGFTQKNPFEKTFGGLDVYSKKVEASLKKGSEASWRTLFKLITLFGMQNFSPREIIQ